MPYNEEYENQLRTHRSKRRLIVARNIHFQASRAEFEAFVRGKLSQPHTATFFWRDSDTPGMAHRGFVMIGFELRTECRTALGKLESIKFRGRSVDVKMASRFPVSSISFKAAAILLSLTFIDGSIAREPLQHLVHPILRRHGALKGPVKGGLP